MIEKHGIFQSGAACNWDAERGIPMFKSLILVSFLLVAPDNSAAGITGRWWESVAAVRNVTLKDDSKFPQLSLDPVKAEQHLRELNKQCPFVLISV